MNPSSLSEPRKAGEAMRPAVHSGLRAALLGHYDRRRRELPWRGETDPYRILVSEIMLQQTRVETVKRYYGRWLERFPDVEALAAASEDDVLKAWEGLGYYRRARNLHRAARTVRERADGAIPSDYAELRGLPGVGAYTAGAVASIAFGVAAPAVDGNVRRVLSRLRDEPDPTPAWLRDVATELIDPQRPGDWNQALMELGATVCTPRTPACDACPVAEWCAARAAGTVGERPLRRTAPAPATTRFVVGVFEHDGRTLLVRRPPDGLLGGMWAFPEAEWSGPDPAAAIAGLACRLRLIPEAGAHRTLPAVEHRFTHLHAVYAPRVVRAEPAPGHAGAAGRLRSARRWVRLEEADALALPVAQRAILEAWSRRRS